MPWRIFNKSPVMEPHLAKMDRTGNVAVIVRIVPAHVKRDAYFLRRFQNDLLTGGDGDC